MTISYLKPNEYILINNGYTVYKILLLERMSSGAVSMVLVKNTETGKIERIHPNAYVNYAYGYTP